MWDRKEAAILLLESLEFAMLIPGLHTKYVYARDCWGKPTMLLNKNACKFCTTGALSAITNEIPQSDLVRARVERYLVRAYKELGYTVDFNHNIVSINDERETTGVDVAEAANKAIEILRRKA